MNHWMNGVFVDLQKSNLFYILTFQIEEETKRNFFFGLILKTFCSTIGHTYQRSALVKSTSPNFIFRKKGVTFKAEETK